MASTPKPLRRRWGYTFPRKEIPRSVWASLWKDQSFNRWAHWHICDGTCEEGPRWVRLRHIRAKPHRNQPHRRGNPHGTHLG